MQDRGMIVRIYLMIKVLRGSLRLLSLPKLSVFISAGEPEMPLGHTWKRSINAFSTILNSINLRTVCDV